jgi:hypoxanthine phosphoribosyltransferase
LKVTKKLSCSLRNRHVIVVDDILDTGRTLRFILGTLREKKPASIRTCVLLDKPACRQVKIRADYVGFKIPNRFVVGYGLDKSGWYRNLRFVGVTRDQIAAG